MAKKIRKPADPAKPKKPRPTMSGLGPLTPKQIQFAHEYIVDLDGAAAARRAGYAASCANVTACTLLKLPNVRKYVNELKAARMERTAISADYVLSTIQEVVERCRQAKPVLDRLGHPVLVETAQGQRVPAYTFDAAGVLKGCELLGKHLKLFTDKLEVHRSADDMTDEELARVARAGIE